MVGDLAEVTFSTDNGLVELSVPATHKATGLQRLAQLANLPVDAGTRTAGRVAVGGAALGTGRGEQVAPVLAAEPTAGQIEEIVVTARQREEKIEDVPVTITA